MSENKSRHRRDELYIEQLVNAILILDSPPASARVPKPYLCNISQSTQRGSSNKCSNRHSCHRIASCNENRDENGSNCVQNERSRRLSAARQERATSDEKNALPMAQTHHMASGSRSADVSGRPPPYPTSGSVSRAVRALSRDHQMESSETYFGMRQPFLASSSPAPEAFATGNARKAGPLSLRTPRTLTASSSSRRCSYSRRSPRSRTECERRSSSVSAGSAIARGERSGPETQKPKALFSGQIHKNRRNRADSVMFSKTSSVSDRLSLNSGLPALEDNEAAQLHQPLHKSKHFLLDLKTVMLKTF